MTKTPLEALEACADQFAFYAEEHRKAGKIEKAETNERFRDMARQALTGAGEPVVPEGTRMFRVSRLIEMLKETQERFGDTCVYARDLSWGAVALNMRKDDADNGIAQGDAMEWPEMPMSRETIRMWIDRINLPEGRAVLEEYLRMKAVSTPDPDTVTVRREDLGSGCSENIQALMNALRATKDLLNVIEQTPTNDWIVKTDDPETAVCNVADALEKVFFPAATDTVEISKDDAAVIIKLCNSIAEGWPPTQEESAALSRLSQALQVKP